MTNGARTPRRTAVRAGHLRPDGRDAVAARARAELRATGESRPRDDVDVDLRTRLTPQELQVVRLAATGLSNRDIATRLFLSPRTVGYHLYKAYPKLGIASRRELARFEPGLAAAAG